LKLTISVNNPSSLLILSIISWWFSKDSRRHTSSIGDSNSRFSSSKILW